MKEAIVFYILYGKLINNVHMEIYIYAYIIININFSKIFL